MKIMGKDLLVVVLETFVYSELLKQTTVSENEYRLLYYRDIDKLEVDIIIENSRGQLVAVEVKASSTIHDSDLKGIKKILNEAKKQFLMGIILYDGKDIIPLGDKLLAAPISTLWGK